MSLRINNNIAAINGRRNMLRNDQAVSKSLEKLSSGLRINRAADDAAGLVISEQMRAQITGLKQAVDNSEIAISMVQTAEGALDEVNNLLNKARELVLHAANAGANDANQLAADQAELDNVIQSITRISEVTQFGTKKLLNGALNGSSALSAGVNRVDVGNLANNAAVATGLVSIQTNGFIFESQELNGGGVTDDGYLFASSGISGVEELTGSLVINNGTSVTLNIDGINYNTISSGSSVNNIINTLNTQLSGSNAGFRVSLGVSGGLNVTRTEAGSTDFVSTFTFARSSGTSAQNALSTAKIDVAGGGSNDAAATAIFNAANNLGDVTTTTVFSASGTIVRGQIFGSGGTTNVSYTVQNGDTMQDALDGLLTAISGAGTLGTGLDASTISFGSASSGLTVTLDSNNQTLAAISFIMEIDLPSSAAIDEEIVAFNLTTVGTNAQEAALFTASGGSGLQAAGTTASTMLKPGTMMNLDIDGQSFTVAGAGQSLDAAAIQMQTQLNTAFGTNTIRIDAIQANTTGAFGMDMTGMDTDPSSAPSFLIARNNNSTTSLTSATLNFENISLTGTDLAATLAAANNGSGSLGSSYNLDTSSVSVAQSGAAAHVAVSLASVTGSTVVTSGNVGVTATLTTANGVSLSLVSSGATSTGGGATLVLDNASGNAGYQNIEIEIDGATASAITSNINFTLDNGAVFQIGANAGQKAGLTIADLDANEIGRNVADTGPLSSLNDLLSTENGALLNGLADEALRVIDASIDEITNLRGDLGAFQANTLETGLSSLRVSSENLTSAESTIRDVDFAEESALFARNNIMIQASTAMLAQANQLPENVLQLLG